MDKNLKFWYIFSIVNFIIGLRIALTWSYTSRIVGVFLLIASLFIAYSCYRKSNILEHNAHDINIKQTLLGFFLIIIDLLYNIISSDTFASFDHGVIFAGILIILLNVGVFRFLKLNKTIISFSTYFIFITMILYGFLFSGLPFILGNKDENILFESFTKSTVIISAYVLNFVKPTYFSETVINFDGFQVGIGDACSGIESLSVFLSSAIAYIIAIKKKNMKKMLKYMLIGGIALYIMNILRIFIIILIGYYMGLDEMLFVHYNLGWVFFLIGMGVFWYLVFSDSDSEGFLK